jgi:hypothetical protein
VVHFRTVAMRDAQTRQRSRLARHWPAVALFALASVVFTWPLARQMQDTLISWGDPVFQTWTLGWNWHALRTDPLGIFDANVFYPWRNTLAYSDHLFGQTLLALPVLALTGNAILADNIAVLTAFFLSGLAMYLLVYDMTRSRAAGVLAGLAYAYAPSRMAHLEHLHLLSAQWAPLVLLCLRRIMLPALPGPRRPSPGWLGRLERRLPPRARNWRDKRWYVALAACFLMQGLSGVYFFYFTIVMLVLAGGWYALAALGDADREAFRRLLLAAGACAVAGLLLFPTLWPYQRVHDDLGIERTTEEVGVWSANARDYLAVWPRNRLYNEALDRNFRHIEQALFPGLFLLVMGAIGLTHRAAGRDRWLLLTVALGAGMLSLGLSKEFAGRVWTLPYQVFYDWLPGFRAIRVPARLGLLALVGLAGLAGLGVAQVWRVVTEELRFFVWYPERLARQSVLAGVLLFTLALGWVGLEGLNRMELPDPLPTESIRPDYDWIAAHPAPTLELPMGDGPVASAWPNFWSLFHWNQTVNGYSGIVPPTYYPFRERMRAFPSDDTLWLLQGIGVENILLHGDFPDNRRAAVEAAIAERPQLTLELSGFDAVYRLAPDPWMWRLAEAIPAGETVDLPNAGADPVAFGLLMAILQRSGHTVEGRGQIDYLTLREADKPRCYAILRARDNPAAFGYFDVEPLLEEPGMILYRHTRCAP